MTTVQLSLMENGDRTPDAPREVLDAPDLRTAPPGVSRLLTARDVAEILRVPRSTVYELARNRRIPFVKVGRRTLFEPDSLRGWIAAHTVQPR